MSLQCFSDISIHRSHLSSTMSQCKHSFCLHSAHTREGYRRQKNLPQSKGNSMGRFLGWVWDRIGEALSSLRSGSWANVPVRCSSTKGHTTIILHPDFKARSPRVMCHPCTASCSLCGGWLVGTLLREHWVYTQTTHSIPGSLQRLWVHRCRPSDKVVTFGLQAPWGKMHEVCHMALLPPLPTQWGAWFFLSKNVSAMSRHRSRALLQIWSIFLKMALFLSLSLLN